MAAKKIPDPYYRDNEKTVQWVSDANWTYRRSFQVEPDILSRRHVLLRCEGLDTLATITVNGTRVAKTDNMFRTYEFDVKKLLVAGSNAIEVRFDSVLPVIRTKEKQRPLGLGTDAYHLRHLERHPSRGLRHRAPGRRSCPAGPFPEGQSRLEHRVDGRSGDERGLEDKNVGQS
jgi:hypothetical protein